MHNLLATLLLLYSNLTINPSINPKRLDRNGYPELRVEINLKHPIFFYSFTEL